ncbi:MAG: cupredoxin domain-containing protein [Vicinamibacterales bacterium]
MRKRREAAVVGAALLATVALAGVPGQETARVEEFEVTARRFAFEPATLAVDKGTRVKITVRSADGAHGFAIEKLGIRKTIPRGGEAITFEFEANEPGNFEIACSEYCGRGHRDMKGMLVVRP